MSFKEFISEIPFFSNWLGVIAWFALFGAFIFFLPYNRKSRIKPSGTFLAFIVASAFEMFGVPLSLYFITWAFGINAPRGILWGHTLENVIGYWGMYIGVSLNVIGGVLIYQGWKVIHKEFWSKEDGKGRLVTEGIYSYMRHPQYTGFILMTLGLLIHWATIPLLLMWPLLGYQYVRLAKKEEEDMLEQFGVEYREYMEKVPRFFPRIPARKRSFAQLARAKNRGY
jgi:protein-S-isoprenylcysteine O-methyltransferase Ste14